MNLDISYFQSVEDLLAVIVIELAFIAGWCFFDIIYKCILRKM